MGFRFNSGWLKYLIQGIRAVWHRPLTFNWFPAGACWLRGLLIAIWSVDVNQITCHCITLMTAQGKRRKAGESVAKSISGICSLYRLKQFIVEGSPVVVTKALDFTHEYMREFDITLVYRILWHFGGFFDTNIQRSGDAAMTIRVICDECENINLCMFITLKCVLLDAGETCLLYTSPSPRD